MALVIGDIVGRAARMRPGATAATLGTAAVTFGELDASANRYANALAGLGVRRGDRVGWLATPTLRALDVFLACARLGAVLAPVNPALPPAVLTYLRPRVLVTNLASLDDLDDLDGLGGLGAPGDLGGLGGPGAPGGLGELGSPGAPGGLGGLGGLGGDLIVATVDGALGATTVDLDALASSARSVPPDGADRVAETDPHIVYLTSGSTGAPKGVLVSHRASWLRAAPGGGTFSASLRGQGVACTFPLYHYGGWHYVMEAWQHGTAVHLVRRADAIDLVDLVRQWRPCALYCIPAVWERLLDREHRAADLSSLRHADTGTSAVAGDLVERIKARLPGSTTTILYGSTEAGRMAALADWDLHRKPGSVGLPAFPGALWVDADGEVCVRSETLMSGYLDLPEESAVALRDGVYRSGDLGHIDDEGYLYLTGRRRDVIRTGGESVAPVEVEEALRDLPGVRDVAVIGLPDDRWGEVVCAVVVVGEAGPAPAAEAIRAHLSGRLPRFKHPRRVAVVPAIPRTPATGQIQRGRLRDDLLAGLA